MKQTSLVILLLLCAGVTKSQPIPPDSLYLGQTPPGSTPVIFELPITAGLRPIERIAVSNDGTELYFGQLNTYPPTVLKINYFKYQNNAWQGPIFLFDGFLGPALSPNDSMLFMQKIIDNYFAESYYAARTSSGWSMPELLFTFEQQSHYSQLTNTGTYYASTVFPGSSLMDISRIEISSDTIPVSLGMPVCTNLNEGDFFIARDESFLIHARSSPSCPADLFISYKKSDGSWTNSKSLGDKINTTIWEYGPFVTTDNKYLFFTRGGYAMSSYYTYWARVDSLIDSLQYTNYAPYMKFPIPDQTAYVGQFFAYTIPDSTFFDDDGNNTLSFQARLANGSPLPQWLTFDSVSCTFSGTPVTQGIVQIKITATDTAGESASTIMKLIVEFPSVLEKKSEQGFLLSPNPSDGIIHIRLVPTLNEIVMLEITDIYGRCIYSEYFSQETHVNLDDCPKGIYLVTIHGFKGTLKRKLILK